MKTEKTKSILLDKGGELKNRGDLEFVVHIKSTTKLEGLSFWKTTPIQYKVLPKSDNPCEIYSLA